MCGGREGTKPLHVTPTSKYLVINSRLRTILNVSARGLPYTWQRSKSKTKVGILPKRSTVSLRAYSDMPVRNALAIPSFSTPTMPSFNHSTTLLTTYFATCARMELIRRANWLKFSRKQKVNYGKEAFWEHTTERLCCAQFFS